MLGPEAASALDALTDAETVACLGRELAHVRNNHALTLGALLVAGAVLAVGSYAAVAARRCRGVASPPACSWRPARSW